MLCLLVFGVCKKSGDRDDVANGEVNFTEIGPVTTSATIISSFATNRKGNAFIVTSINEDNNSQTHFGSGTKWTDLSTFGPKDAAISESGVVIYFDHSGKLKRCDGSGTIESIPLSGFNYHKVEMGMDGHFYAGSSNGKIYKSGDEGKTWTETDIPENRFNYSGNLAVGFLVHSDGKMFSYIGGGRLYQSVDAGKTWSQINITIDYSNTGSVNIYSPISHDHNGNIYILGSTGVSVVNTVNLNSRSVSFQSALLNSAFERLEKFASDAQGVLYATATNKGYDYEHRKLGAAIYKFSGNIWQKLPTPYPYTGFSGMDIQATQAGMVSVANGVRSKGLYAMDASGKYTEIGAPQSFENLVVDIAPLNNGKVFASVKHPTPIGTIMGASLNPAYPVLMVLENGQWKHTEKASDKVFVASNGDIYSVHNVDVSLSKDSGQTWQTNTLVVDDPLNLRNFLQAEALHFTELNGEVHAYFGLAFGGVGGAYANFSWTKAPLGSTNFNRLVGKAGNYRPSDSEIPLVTAAKGTTGFFYRPFYEYAYYPARQEEVLFTEDGGASYATAGFSLPFAGSNSGYYVAWGAGGFLISAPANPLDFSPTYLKVPDGEIDMNRYNGVNYFTTWARFGTDNKLYLNHNNKIYIGDKVF